MYSIAAMHSGEVKLHTQRPSSSWYSRALSPTQPKFHAMLVNSHPPYVSLAGNTRPAFPVFSLMICPYSASSCSVFG